MAKLDRLTPGQVLYTVTRHRMGNTMMRTVSVHDVRVIEVNTTEGWVLASWNGNPPQKFYEGRVAKWKVKQPKVVTNSMGQQRLARRGELPS